LPHLPFHYSLLALSLLAPCRLIIMLPIHLALFLICLALSLHTTIAQFIDFSKLPHCEHCANCKVPSEGGVQLVGMISDQDRLFYIETPKDLINFQYKVDVIHGDSSQAQFTISRKLPKGAKAEAIPSKTVFRIKFYNQQGYGSDWFVTLNGYGQCQTTVIGPPNIEGRLLMNVLAFRK
jgi:hypothetical protein